MIVFVEKLNGLKAGVGAEILTISELFFRHYNLNKQRRQKVKYMLSVIQRSTLSENGVQD